MSSIPARLALVLAFVGSVGVASAATLHRPLPANSLERNGTPQPMQHHAHHHALVPPALTSRAPFKYAVQGLKRHYAGTPVDVLTYHYDLKRTGWNPTETDLTPANVGSANFGQLTQLQVDGNVFAQPLLVSNFTMPDGSVHNVLVIATGHDSVYAFDADTYATLWQVSLGQSQSTNDVGCGDVQPEYGISSTPVIVRSGANAASIYVVAATEPAHLSFHTQLHELNLANGADVVSPVEIAPQAKIKGGSGTISFDPQNQWNRAGLAFDNGNLYIGIGSHCDNNAGGISGWLLDYDTATLKLIHHFHTIETAEGYELSSIWMTGFAPAIDDNGNVFVVTGNGAFGRGRDWGESVLRLPSNVAKVQDSFTPAAYRTLNNGDTDFGSGGVMLLPVVSGQTAPPMAVAMGKAAILYLLNQDALGKLQTGDAGALQWQRLSSGSGLWGGPAYYGSPNGGMVYAQGNGGKLLGYSVATGSLPSLTQVASGTSSAGYGGSLPIVSSNGATPSTGVVWLVNRNGGVTLEAYDALALGAPLFSANAGVWSNPGQGNPFVTPMEADGRVYVPAYKTVTVFGLGN
jgi:hypothetical protein